MTTREDGADNSLNCVGIGYRPLERSSHVVPSEVRPPLKATYQTELFKCRPSGNTQVRRPQNVKRMRKRRDRAKKASASGHGSDILIKLPDESVSTDKENEDVKEVNSRPSAARILLGICGILFVILGLGVLIYAVILVISSMSNQNFSASLSNRFKIEPVSTHKMTFSEWQEKNAKEQRI